MSKNKVRWSSYTAPYFGGCSFSEFSFITDLFSTDYIVPFTHPYIKFDVDWHNVSYGSYFNGVGKYGTAGSSFKIKFNKSISEFIIIGDQFTYEEDNDTIVKVNNEIIGEFSEVSYGTLFTSSKSYKNALFVGKDIDHNQQQLKLLLNLAKSDFLE